MITIILLCIITLLLTQENEVECMDTNDRAKQAADLISQGNEQQGNQILAQLRTRPLTADQIEHADHIMNQTFRENDHQDHGVHHLELHNTGTVPHLTWRDYATALLIASVFAISIYYIVTHWEDIRNTLFGGARRIATTVIVNPVQAVLYARIERYLVHNPDPQVISELHNIIVRSRFEE